MQIVIEIPKRDYEYIKKLERGSTDYGITLHLYDAVRNGTPLPEHYGRWEDCSNGWMCSNCYKDSTKEYDFCPNCGARMRR